MTLASPGHCIIPGSTYSVDDRISFYHSPVATLPAAVTEGTVYYVGTVTSTIDITISTTAANANPVNFAGVGAGWSAKQTPLAVANLVTPSFAASALKLVCD
jgi:hypothetical protein